LGFGATPLWTLYLLTFVCETIVKRGTKNSFRGDFLAKFGKSIANNFVGGGEKPTEAGIEAAVKYFR